MKLLGFEVKDVWWRRNLRQFRLQRKPKEKRLIYTSSRCVCGALLAYDPAEKPRPRAWDCSDILLGLAIESGQPESVMHSDTYPFAFWKIKSVPTDWALENRKVKV